MATRIFALLIGIDRYKSGHIWNLESCTDDAQSIRHWLTHDLHVPRDHICTLLDSQATKRNIEDKFMSHLVNNSNIEPGDAILFFFAGHGSCLRAPNGWFERGGGEVEVLCPYDHDTRVAEGRIAGISDRSLNAMLRDLCEVKGDNITVILDTSPSPPRGRDGSREKHPHTRWTPTVKASPDDLLSGLWKSAMTHRKQTLNEHGFTGVSCDTHVVLAACSPGWSAHEGKSGGNLTRALLTCKDNTAIHKLTYADLRVELTALMDGHQQAVCVGENRDRVLFDGAPFVPDARYAFAAIYDHESLRIDAGAIHGVVEGTEFSIHKHNCRGSLNPTMGAYYAVEVHPTWCLARNRNQATSITREGWARITRWNNRTPFCVHVRKSLFWALRRCRLCSELPNRKGVNIARVKNAADADMSVTLRRRELIVERQDALIASNCRRVIRLPSEQMRSDLKIIDAASRFHLHLHRKNPQKPLLDMVNMELYRLDPSTWARTSGNLLVDGRAQIVDDGKGSIYAVVLHNHSNTDLWPYLAYMDATGYSISMVYHPDASMSAPPLRKHSHMVIGSGTIDSEALSFALAEDADTGAGFMKLFVSSTFTPMTSIEQGPSPPLAAIKKTKLEKRDLQEKQAEDIWDSMIACITVVRKQDAKA